MSDLWRASTTSAVNVCGSFTPSEFAVALKHLKPGKAPGPDSICPELLLHAGAALKSWLCGFLSSCLHHLKIPKIWRRALVVAIPKPMKPVEDPKSYRPISLLYFPYNRDGQPVAHWLLKSGALHLFDDKPRLHFFYLPSTDIFQWKTGHLRA